MNEIKLDVPDGSSGDWRVETFVVSEREAAFSQVRATATGGREEAVAAGEYKRLCRGGTVVMSNVPMEIRTHRAFIWKAKGHVLINGLGLGMALTEILKNPLVLSVTIIEKSKDVIDLVAPTFLKDPRVAIIHADAFEWKAPKGVVYDAVWHDIWDDISCENLPEMARLHRKYGRRSHWQGSWARAECEIHRDRSRAWRNNFRRAA